MNKQITNQIISDRGYFKNSNTGNGNSKGTENSDRNYSNRHIRYESPERGQNFRNCHNENVGSYEIERFNYHNYENNWCENYDNENNGIYGYSGSSRNYGGRGGYRKSFVNTNNGRKNFNRKTRKSHDYGKPIQPNTAQEKIINNKDSFQALSVEEVKNLSLTQLEKIVFSDSSLRKLENFRQKGINCNTAKKFVIWENFRSAQGKSSRYKPSWLYYINPVNVDMGEYETISLNEIDALSNVDLDKIKFSDDAKQKAQQMVNEGFTFHDAKKIIIKDYIETYRKPNQESPNSSSSELDEPPKKKLHTETNDEENSDTLNIAIVQKNFPETFISNEKLKYVKNAIIKAYESLSSDGPEIRFSESVYMIGYLLIKCANKESADWLQEIAPSLQPWEGAVLEAVLQKHLIELKTCSVFIEDDEEERLPTERILNRLKVGNRDLKIHFWKITANETKENGQSLDFLIDPDSLEVLKNLDMKPYFGLGRVKFEQKHQKVDMSCKNNSDIQIGIKKKKQKAKKITKCQEFHGTKIINNKSFEKRLSSNKNLKKSDKMRSLESVENNQKVEYNHINTEIEGNLDNSEENGNSSNSRGNKRKYEKIVKDHENHGNDQNNLIINSEEQIRKLSPEEILNAKIGRGKRWKLKSMICNYGFSFDMSKRVLLWEEFMTKNGFRNDLNYPAWLDFESINPYHPENQEKLFKNIDALTDPEMKQIEFSTCYNSVIQKYLRMGKSLLNAKKNILKDIVKNKVKPLCSDPPNISIEEKRLEDSSEDANIIEIAIVHKGYSKILIEQERLIKVRHAIMRAYEDMASDALEIRFLGYVNKPGYLLIKCADKVSANWLQKIISSLQPWEGAVLEAFLEKELQQQIGCTVFIPHEDEDKISAQRILRRLKISNRSLKTSAWKIIGNREIENGKLWEFKIDEESLEELKKLNMNPYFGIGRVNFVLNHSKT